jgi:2-oxo-4-hydroxy-4-carboxy-5-ureidoimidazoline decarboxylase
MAMTAGWIFPYRIFAAITIPQVITTRKMDTKPTVEELLAKPKQEILEFLGGIYEHSKWVAETFHDEFIQENEHISNISNVRELHLAMSSVVTNATTEQKLELLCAHPDLCAKIEKLSTLTKESQVEQSSAGLHTLTDDEKAYFTKMNNEYKKKFGFPFILAARNVTKYTVLSAIEGRLQLSNETEFAGALVQVGKIAWMRLLAALNITGQKGFLTCHVLDTANGCPAEGMRIQLHRLAPDEQAGLVKEFTTNSDGRLDGPALKEESFIVGTYEWTFFVGDYFARKNVKTAGVPFLNEVPLRFGIDDPEEHYHVPLLVSPWSYSTYRGS